MKTENVLTNLSYFVEWGGHSWEKLCRYAIQNLGDLQGKTVLEVGPRFGKMSACFALLGAEVVGVETDETALKRAEEEVKRWGVHTHVSFLHYDGDLGHCAELSQSRFDFIFTKSVLVLLGSDLFDCLQKLDQMLKPNGKCIFLENRHGGAIFSFMRRVHPKTRSYSKRVTYLKPSHLRLIGQVFHIIELKKSLIPPIYLLVVQKKSLIQPRVFEERFIPC